MGNGAALQNSSPLQSGQTNRVGTFVAEAWYGQHQQCNLMRVGTPRSRGRKSTSKDVNVGKSAGARKAKARHVSSELALKRPLSLPIEPLLNFDRAAREQALLQELIEEEALLRSPTELTDECVSETHTSKPATAKRAVARGPRQPRQFAARVSCRFDDGALDEDDEDSPSASADASPKQRSEQSPRAGNGIGEHASLMDGAVDERVLAAEDEGSLSASTAASSHQPNQRRPRRSDSGGMKFAKHVSFDKSAIDEDVPLSDNEGSPLASTAASSLQPGQERRPSCGGTSSTSERPKHQRRRSLRGMPMPGALGAQTELEEEPDVFSRLTKGNPRPWVAACTDQQLLSYLAQRGRDPAVEPPAFDDRRAYIDTSRRMQRRPQRQDLFDACLQRSLEAASAARMQERRRCHPAFFPGVSKPDYKGDGGQSIVASRVGSCADGLAPDVDVPCAAKQASPAELRQCRVRPTKTQEMLGATPGAVNQRSRASAS